MRTGSLTQPHSRRARPVRPLTIFASRVRKFLLLSYIWAKAHLKGATQKEDPMPYVDGFVVAVPKKNLPAYKKMALAAGKVWMEHGALEFKECVADDVKVGKLTSFPQAVKLKPGEVVFFSYIVYKNRAARDKINKKVMADPRLNDMMAGKDMPFDGKRMIYGGFETLVELSA